LNRRRRHRQVQPIYDAQDAAACLALVRSQPDDAWFEVLEGIRARFWNAGHLLGSASIELELAGAGADPMRVMFSADIGPDYKLMDPDPAGPTGVDYLVCESTYGDTDRIDATPAHRRARLRDEVRVAMSPKGALLIPSFAVERAQELISDLGQLITEGELPRIPIYVDSPLAARATEVFARHAGELTGGEALLAGLGSRDLHFTESVEESKALDRADGFHIVIAASGMCEAGRIRPRLKNWLWHEEATVLLVGYQAVGTLGRILQDGAKSVRIHGDEFDVRARIRSLDLYSGHADGPELVAWVRARLPLAHQLFLVHGEPEAIAALAARLDGVVPDDDVLVPALDETFELTPDGAVRLAQAEPPRITPEMVARMDWHNDVSRLFLDINDALRNAADDRARNVLIRRLAAALEDAGT
jgi:metallo-beta-lactamase family protein